VYLTSTYVQESPGRLEERLRLFPDQEPDPACALEANLASLENGRFGLAFSSGMGATNTVLNLLKQGITSSRATISMGHLPIFTKLFRNYGLTFTFVDLTDLDGAESFTDQTKLLFVETPVQPAAQICDLKALAELRASAR
jgi:cystathionine gamma-lyase/cystathionine beta-lyase